MGQSMSNIIETQCCPEQKDKLQEKKKQEKLQRQTLIKEKLNEEKTLNRDDFEKICNLGEGAYGIVYLVKYKNKDDDTLYAMKKLSIKKIFKNELLFYTILEQTILKVNQCPFIVNLHYSFQTNEDVYFVMDFAMGGQLYTYIQKKKLNKEKIQFIFAEIIIAIKHLHQKFSIIYRDLKPENIVINKDGHIKLIDFGCCKQIPKQGEYLKELVGTPEYIAPEIIESKSKGHGKEIDFWSLGILLYEMIQGKTPFFNFLLQDTYYDILYKNPEFSTKFNSQEKDLILKLLQKNPQNRLGVKDFNEIQSHAYFKNIDWDKLENLQIKSPLLDDVNEMVSQQNLSRVHGQMYDTRQPLSQEINTKLKELNYQRKQKPVKI